MKINDDTTADFDINEIGDKTNQSYMGHFKVKCLLSPMEEIAADKTYRELLGMNSHLAQEHIRQQAFALAQLDQRLIEFPPFWENTSLGGGHIQDRNIILHVLDRAIEAQEEFCKKKRDELRKKQEELTNLIKNKKIEKEPEVEVPEEAPEIDLE